MSQQAPGGHAGWCGTEGGGTQRDRREVRGAQGYDREVKDLAQTIALMWNWMMDCLTWWGRIFSEVKEIGLDKKCHDHCGDGNDCKWGWYLYCWFCFFKLYGRVDLSNQIQKSKVARWENKYLLTLTVQLNHHHHHHHHYYDRLNHHHHILQHQSHAIKITLPALFLMATKKWNADTFSNQTGFTERSFNLVRS